ncbi:MAG: hypothetical protein CMC07_11535, partial [Flavobacteriaceae bacterium]|nr:hypothetical protein [Flavobacteriaceae bacterium]
MQRKTSNQAFPFVLIICFFFSLSIFGQTEGKKSLFAVIQQLEEQHNIRFSYVPDEISDISVTVPEKTDSLQEVLTQLNNQTPLRFTLLDDRYVTVVSPQRKNNYC